MFSAKFFENSDLNQNLLNKINDASIWNLTFLKFKQVKKYGTKKIRSE